MYIASLSSWGVHLYGNRLGGRKAAQTNKERYGADFYESIGRAGGRKSRGGGFAANPELAREAGRKGGRKSRGGGRKPAAA
jgi:uncharacterized protein